MFNSKKLKEHEQRIARLEQILTNPPTKEIKETKEEQEKKERIEKAWQELFNYNERIAIKGDK